ncbi:CPBP family intramembrane glutamic endopeptidase [Kocuria salsicia]|uniref:CPBP family intramembrane glutamic endopeptidase n=1 Tax=Kocuria salsicia TaxID=664639 RepID=UPI0011A149EA|nr:CPBP family intramembrane glutamic endopeptidase [Kocuria salsicia]
MTKRTKTPRSKPTTLFDTWSREWFRVRDVIGPGYFAGRAFSPALAYVLVLGLYVGSGYLHGTVAAAVSLLTGASYADTYTYEGLWRSVGWIVLAVTVWVMVTRLLLPAPSSGPHHVTQRRDATLALFLYPVATLIGTALMRLLGSLLGYDPEFPSVDHPSGEYIAASVASSAAAGFREEVFLLALPVLLLRCARRGWTEIVVVLAVLRLSFHIYYGAAVIGMLPWAVAAVFLFRYTQSVWPLIAAHSLWDLGASALTFGGDLGELALLWHMLAFGGCAWLLLGKVSRERELSEPVNVTGSEQRLLSGSHSA